MESLQIVIKYMKKEKQQRKGGKWQKKGTDEVKFPELISATEVDLYCFHLPFGVITPHFPWAAPLPHSLSMKLGRADSPL